jgi:hypothetical protein
MRLARPPFSALSPLLPLLITLALTPPEASGSIPLRLIADPAGENDGDSFGVSVASVGDLNGDGYDDLVVGANYYPSLSGHGRAYIFRRAAPGTRDACLAASRAPERRVLREHADGQPRAGSEADLAGPHALTRHRAIRAPARNGSSEIARATRRDLR